MTRTATTIAEAAERLTAAGYREYRQDSLGLRHADRFFQKAVKHGDTKFYFLNVGIYDQRRYSRHVEPPVVLQVDASLYHPELDSPVTLDLSVRPDEIDAAEAFIHRLYEGQGFEPDRVNN